MDLQIENKIFFEILGEGWTEGQMNWQVPNNWCCRQRESNSKNIDVLSRICNQIAMGSTKQLLGKIESIFDLIILRTSIIAIYCGNGEKYYSSNHEKKVQY